jgi:type I restriction enzyme, S subunit
VSKPASDYHHADSTGGNTWRTVRLRDICTIDKQQGMHTNLPYVGLEDIESSTGRFIGSLENRTAQSSTFRFTGQHVLYGRLRPYLNKTMAPDFEGHCSTEIFPLLPRAGLNRRFLQYWLMQQRIVDLFNQTCTGARMPRANVEAALCFPLRVPSDQEQQRIVAILDESLEGIAIAESNATRNLASAREAFQSTLELKFSTDHEGWITKKLHKLCTFKHGFAFKSENFRSEGELVLLTPGNFYERGGYRDRAEKQRFYEGDFPRDFLLQPGALLVAMTEQAAGLLGSPILIPESGTFLHNQRLGLAQPLPGVPWLNSFFFYAFNTTNFRRKVHDSASGVKVRHTSPTKLGDVSISFPPSLEEQRRVVIETQESESDTQRLEAIYRTKLIALTELKQSLLHQAFSGKL